MANREFRKYGVDVVEPTTGNRFTQWFESLVRARAYCDFVNGGRILTATIRERRVR